MRAAILHAPMDLRIDDVQTPECTSTTAIVRVCSCAICGSDVHMYTGDHPFDYPAAMGHEASGDVVAVGDDVEGLDVGDRITWWVSYGSLAEYVRIEPAKLSVGKLADHVSYDHGATTQLLCAVIRALGSVSIGEEDRVLVVGQGGVGLLAVQVAKLAGAQTVIGTDLLESRLAVSRRVGASMSVNAAQADLRERVLSAGGPVSVVIDAMADDRSAEETGMADAISCLAPGGTYLMVGLSATPRVFSPYELVQRQVTVVPAFQPLDRVRPLCQRACDLVADGSIDVGSLLTHTATLDDTPGMFERVMSRPHEIVKAMIRMHEG